jgi:hypothetical protein
MSDNDNSPVILNIYNEPYQYGFDKNLISYNTCIYKNRCSGCNKNLASNDPISLYQKQKIIQKTVRVPSSLFTMNLASLNTYQRPQNNYNIVDVNGSPYITSPNVNWNQMSDRRHPHIQVVKSGSGSTYGASSTKRTKTRLRPGALSPGGSGVDIKHNSYERYLNRIKGKAPLRRQTIPSELITPFIPFNRAYPIYGGKVMKTSIVNNCNCPITDNKLNEKKLYKSFDYQYNINNVRYQFNIGDYVWAKQCTDSPYYEKAIVIGIDNDIIDVRFSDGTEVKINKCKLLIYFDCSNCNYTTGKEINVNSVIERVCLVQEAEMGGNIFPTDDSLLKGYNYFL